MDKEQLISKLREKKEVAYDAETIPVLLEITETEKTAVKYQAEKLLRAGSAENPLLLYPYFTRIAALLDHPNRFLKWGSMLTIANLLSVDGKHFWYGIREKYLRSYESQEIAEFGNAVQSVPKVLAAYPEDEKTILPLLLEIDSHPFFRKGEPSPACTDVAKGHILDCFTALFPASAYQKEMISFAKRNRKNARGQVRTKATRFLETYGK